jgi:hypothetical protein
MLTYCLLCGLCTDPNIAAFQSQHSDVFPSRSLLQAKIREVRQRVMNANSDEQMEAAAQKDGNAASSN